MSFPLACHFLFHPVRFACIRVSVPGRCSLVCLCLSCLISEEREGSEVVSCLFFSSSLSSIINIIFLLFAVPSIVSCVLLFSVSRRERKTHPTQRPWYEKYGRNALEKKKGEEKKRNSTFVFRGFPILCNSFPITLLVLGPEENSLLGI